MDDAGPVPALKLYLLRHGLSPSLSEAGVGSDAERPLAPQGAQDVRCMAELLRGKGGRPGAVLTSPLRRARETAQEAAEVLRPELGVIVFEPLSNHLDARELCLRLAADGPRVPALLAVGHQPQLGELASFLSGASPEIRPGGLCALEGWLREGGASLLWSRNP